VGPRFVDEKDQKATTSSGPAEGGVHILLPPVSPLDESNHRLGSQDILHLLGGDTVLACQLFDDSLDPNDAIDAQSRLLPHAMLPACSHARWEDDTRLARYFRELATERGKRGLNLGIGPQLAEASSVEASDLSASPLPSAAAQASEG
jgi:hypothetical protein